MSRTLPPVIEALRDAVNAGDTEGFLALFADDGAVDDWGRRFAGKAAIRSWSDEELIGAHGTLTFGEILEASDARVRLVADWQSSFFSGPGVFTFTLADGRIAQMTIAQA
jgi:ketosteroid isomerase-like protein